MRVNSNTGLTCRSLIRLLAEHEEFILFDTETTGLSPGADRIIEVSALKVRSRDFEILERLTVYIRPEIPVPHRIEQLTGITNAFLAAAPPEDKALERISVFFGRNIVCGAYNASFDRGFMEALYQRHGQSFQTGREIFDVLQMARELVAKDAVSSFRLASMISYFKLDEEEVSFHNAEDDTRAMYRLFCRLYQEYLSHLPQEPDNGLHAAIRTVQRWEGPGGRSRIYVNLKSPYGTVYYDLNLSRWANKDRRTDILSQISLELLRQDVFSRTGASTEADLWNFTGKA